MVSSARYGSWASPITADLLVEKVVGLSDPLVDGDSVLWVESRPNEAGRQVVVRRDASGAIADVLPEGFSARTVVHEYGGRCATVHAGALYFTNFADQRLYRLES